MGHTPGPWEVAQDATPEWHKQATVYDEQDGKRVATVFLSDANAALVAAAPDLLEALKKWEQFMLANYNREDIFWWDDTRAAIAKATGEG